ncbi:unnamed protein product, partial [Phaeothamnion confervicola]
MAIKRCRMRRAAILLICLLVLLAPFHGTARDVAHADNNEAADADASLHVSSGGGAGSVGEGAGISELQEGGEDNNFGQDDGGADDAALEEETHEDGSAAPGDAEAAVPALEGTAPAALTDDDESTAGASFAESASDAPAGCASSAVAADAAAAGGDATARPHRTRNMLGGAMRSYDRLLREHYYKVNFLQATTLGVTGDLIAQCVERISGRVPPPCVGGGEGGGVVVRRRAPFGLDLRRTADVGILTMIIDGVLTPQWYTLMERLSAAKTVPVALLKTLLGTVVYGPIANGIFLAGVPVMRFGFGGIRAGGFDLAAWRRQLLVASVRDLQMWPPFNFLNFWLVPMHWRPLAANFVGLGFVAVLSATGLSDEVLPFGAGVVLLLAGRAAAAAAAVQRLGDAAGAAAGAAVRAIDVRLVALVLAVRAALGDLPAAARRRVP